MKYLAIDKNPFRICYALFELETKELLEWGIIPFYSKDENERIQEIWKRIGDLLNYSSPTVVLTHWIDLLKTKKKDLEYIVGIKTILRKLCFDRKIIYAEFRTYGWEKRITNMKMPSTKAKLKIAQEYSKNIKDISVANAVILGEGVVHNRLQIGKE